MQVYCTTAFYIYADNLLFYYGSTNQENVRQHLISILLLNFLLHLIVYQQQTFIVNISLSKIMFCVYKGFTNIFGGSSNLGILMTHGKFGKNTSSAYL